MHVLDNGVCTTCPEIGRHLPGLHDQSTHGRRFKVPGDPKSGLRKALKSARKAEKPTPQAKAEARFEPKIVAELQASQDRYLKEAGRNALTQGQRDALKAYSLAGYQVINGWLRGRKGHENPHEQVKQAVEDLKSTMMPLQEPAVFVRGGGWSLFPDGYRDAESAKQLVGRTVQDPGFLSTSVPGARLAVKGGKVHLIVEAPKGTQGRLIRDMSEVKDEDEYLFQPGSRFKILEVSGENPTTIRVRAVV